MCLDCYSTGKLRGVTDTAAACGVACTNFVDENDVFDDIEVDVVDPTLSQGMFLLGMVGSDNFDYKRYHLDALKIHNVF